jgi:iron(III) transport system substrate-binding protein
MTGASRRAFVALMLAGALGASGAAQGQDAVDEAAAKAEGTVVWYSSTPIAIAQELASMFEKKTGVKVDLFRSGGSQIMRRFQQEAQAGRVAADVLTASDPGALADLAEKGAFTAFKPAHFDKVPESARDPQGRYVAQRLNLVTIYYRTDKVAPEDVPTTLAELVNPKYKGKLVIADPSFAALQLAVMGTIAQKLGWDFYEKLAENDAMVVQGGEQVSDMVKRGERLIAVAASNSYAADARIDGFPIKTVYPADGTFIVPSPSAIVAGSTHPNAAKLFATFLLSDEAQVLFPKNGGYASRTDVAPPEGSPALAEMKITEIDDGYIRKEGGAIKRRFTQIFK